MKAPGSPSSALQTTYLAGRDLLGDQLPLEAGGVAGAAASAQAALLDLLDDFARGHVVERLGEGLVAAGGDVVGEFLGIDAAAVGQHDLDLPGEERRIEIDGARGERLAVDGVGADQGGRIGRRGVAVEMAVGGAQDQRSAAAHAHAAGAADLDSGLRDPGP